MLLFVIRGTTFTGADIGGLKYDGTIEKTSSGIKCSIVYIIPAGASLITGTDPPSSDQRIPVEFLLPEDFWNGQTVGIATPLGPVNARFQKLRDL
jgi:hypothetical protein